MWNKGQVFSIIGPEFGVQSTVLRERAQEREPSRGTEAWSIESGLWAAGGGAQTPALLAFWELRS